MLQRERGRSIGVACRTNNSAVPLIAAMRRSLPPAHLPAPGDGRRAAATRPRAARCPRAAGIAVGSRCPSPELEEAAAPFRRLACLALRQMIADCQRVDRLRRDRVV